MLRNIYKSTSTNENEKSIIEEISAMKLEVIGNSGRKKDFWDMHELLEHLTIEQMIAFHAERYPYSYTKETLINKLVNFQFADDDLTPICLKGKYWELIKEDLREMKELLPLIR